MPEPRNVKLGDRRSHCISVDRGLTSTRPLRSQTRPLMSIQSTDLAHEMPEKLPDTLSRTDVLLKLLPPEQLKDMQRVFNMFDDDGGGSISASELCIAFRKLNLITNRSLLKAIVEAIDVDGDGQISLGEFCALLTQRWKPSDVGDEDVDIDGEDDARGGNELDAAKDSLQKRQAFDFVKEQQRQEALRYFKHAVATMAFDKSNIFKSTSPRATAELSKVVRQLGLRPVVRSEWELLRVLHWSERFEFIKQLPPAVQSNQRIDVCRMMRSQHISSGGVLYRQGDPGDCMYFLFAGQVELRHKLEGTDRPQIAVKREFENFGQEALLDITGGERRESSAIAMSDCTLASLTRHDWIRYVRSKEVAPIVDQLQRHPAMAACKRRALLQMALEFKSVQFHRCVHSILLCTKNHYDSA